MGEYWCFILERWENKFTDRIIEKKILTFPSKVDISDGDIVFIYVSSKQLRGFLGYVKVCGTFERNDTAKVKIFDDICANKYYINVRHHRFSKKMLLSTQVFGDNDAQKKAFGNLKHRHSLVNIPNDMGETIKRGIRNPNPLQHKKTQGNNTQKNTKHSSKSKTTHECTKHTMHIIKKSRYIIPIMIIPCDECADISHHTDDTNRAMAILSHVSKCRKCDVTNNNERVYISIFQNPTISYRIVRNGDKLEKILDAYLASEYYKECTNTCDTFTMIKICNADCEYNKCFCIIGKMTHRM